MSLVRVLDFNDYKATVLLPHRLDMENVYCHLTILKCLLKLKNVSQHIVACALLLISWLGPCHTECLNEWRLTSVIQV